MDCASFIFLIFRFVKFETKDKKAVITSKRRERLIQILNINVKKNKNKIYILFDFLFYLEAIHVKNVETQKYKELNA